MTLSRLLLAAAVACTLWVLMAYAFVSVAAGVSP